MRRGLNSRLDQRAVEHGTHFRNGQRTIHFLAIHEKSRGGGDPQRVALVQRGLHRGLILSFDASVKLHDVHVMLLTGQQGGAVDGIKLRIAAFPCADGLLVGVSRRRGPSSGD